MWTAQKNWKFENLSYNLAWNQISRRTLNRLRMNISQRHFSESEKHTHTHSCSLYLFQILSSDRTFKFGLHSSRHSINIILFKLMSLINFPSIQPFNGACWRRHVCFHSFSFRKNRKAPKEYRNASLICQIHLRRNRKYLHNFSRPSRSSFESGGIRAKF